MARAYKEAGYCAIAVTDHFFNGNTAIRGNYAWNKKISLFMRGYEDAKAEGKKIGLDVYFGFEYSDAGTDFLIYNLGEEWLCSYPEIMTDSLEFVMKKIRADGGFIVHAHPFRSAVYIQRPGRVFPEYTDGVEVINKGNGENSQADILALEYAKKYNLIQFAGSDIHSVNNLTGGGMAFERKPKSFDDIIEMAAKKECILM
jgi:predicted metal-dependent phosphoesterase TrpH